MLNKSEIAILTIAVSIGSQNYFKMKQCRHFMQITYSPNNVLVTMSCRLRGGCERLLVKYERTAPAVKQQVMTSPDEAPCLIRYAYQAKAHERNVIQLETGGPLTGQISFELCIA